MPLYTFGPWRPDLPDVAQLDDTGSLRLTEATNVTPGVGCYHPQAYPVAVTDSITSTCMGAFACIDRDGNVNWFAGTASSLERISSSTATWSTVGTNYALSPEDRWEFVNYGNQVYATAITESLQFMTLSAGSSMSDVGGASPRFRHMAVVRNFLVGANTADDPQRVQWSALDNPQSWTVDATTLADFQDLLGPGGWNQGIVVGLAGADAVIFQEHSVWRMLYVGLPLVFQFDPVESARGAISPGSIVQSAGFAFYFSDDGFYQFDGATSKAIGDGKVDRFFAGDADIGNLGRMSAIADPTRPLVFWSYKSTNGAIPDRILAYNWNIEEWSLLEQECELLWRSLRRHATPYGVPITSTFSPSHRASIAATLPLAARITTAEYQLNPAGRTLVTELYPIINASGTPTTTIIHRRNATISASSEPAVTMNASGFAPLRVDDRLMRFRQDLTANDTWDEWRGFKLTAVPTGER